jgi:gluconolactonase
MRRSGSLLSSALLVTQPLACGSSDAPAAPSNTGSDSGGPKQYPPLDFADIGQPVSISEQFYRSEGPIWDPARGVLLFTDIVASAGGTIYRLTLPNTVEVELEPDGNANGLALDHDGKLIAAGHAAGNVWRRSVDAMQTLAPCASPATATCFEGQPLNAPNDIVARSDGTIYFTDPNFAGELEGFPLETRPLAGAEGVYRLAKDGSLSREDVGTSGPNGIGLSPDERTLYVTYTVAGMVARFDIATDGSLSNKQTFATGTTVADGMCVDAGGNVYVGTLAGLAVFSPGGDALGKVEFPRPAVTNCSFGGSDQKTLFVTVYASIKPTKDDAGLFAIEAMPIPGIPGRN